MSVEKSQERFDFLDGIRGMAAIAVMVYHYTYFNSCPLILGAFTAVDIFFIMSGFVIAHSYGEKIRSGMSFFRFFSLRMIRLYPLYFIGLSSGFVVLIFSSFRYENISDFFSQLIRSYMLNLFMIPYFGDLLIYERGVAKNVSYPSNPVLWSLFFEVFASLVFFAYVKASHKLKSIPMAVVGMLLFFAVGLYLGQPNPGWGGINFLGGIPRVIGEFAVGTVLYNYRNRVKFANAWLMAFLSFMVLVSFAVRFKGSWIIYDLILYPVFILMGAKVVLEGAGKVIASSLGKLSFPIYIIHLPIYMIAYDWTGIQVLPEHLRLVILATTTCTVAAVLYKVDSIIRERVLKSLFASGKRKLGDTR